MPAVVGIVERLVPDELWELFQRVVPEVPLRPQGAVGVGTVIARCWRRLCSWRRPAVPGSSCRRRPSGRRERRPIGGLPSGARARVWAKLHRLVLDELGARGELDWSRCAIDSVNMRALKRGT